MLDSIVHLPGCEGDSRFFLHFSIIVALVLGLANFSSSIQSLLTYKSDIIRALEIFFEKKIDGKSITFSGNTQSMQTISIAPYVAYKIVLLSDLNKIENIFFERLVFLGSNKEWKDTLDKINNQNLNKSFKSIEFRYNVSFEDENALETFK